jgi:hypothetical protein
VGPRSRVDVMVKTVYADAGTRTPISSHSGLQGSHFIDCPYDDLAIILTASIRTCKCFISMTFLLYNSIRIPYPVTFPVHQSFLHSTTLTKQYFVRNVLGVHVNNKRQNAGRIRSVVHNGSTIPQCPLCLNLLLLFE